MGYTKTIVGNIPEHWKIWLVQDLVELGIIEPPEDGNHGELHPKERDYVDEGIPFIMASDLKDGYVDLNTCKFIKEEQAALLRKGFAKPGDILLTHKATAVLEECKKGSSSSDIL